MDINIKVFLCVIFCIIYTTANDELTRLSDQAKTLVENFNNEYQKKKQNDPNIDYISEVYKKLGTLLTNDNLQKIPGLTEKKGEIDAIMNEIKVLRLELQLLKVELANFKTENRKGEKGAAGIEGPAGEKGSRGEKGEKGEIGSQGQRGFSGLPGPMGPIGLKGVKGARGEHGQKGDMGAKGDPGENIFTPIIPVKNQN